MGTKINEKRYRKRRVFVNVMHGKYNENTGKKDKVSCLVHILEIRSHIVYNVDDNDPVNCLPHQPLFSTSPVPFGSQTP